MIMDPKENRPTRVGIERNDQGERARVTRRSNSRLAT
jgi:ribosomal protein L24